MSRLRNIARIVFLVLTASTLIYLLRNVDSNVINVAKFKLETIDKLKSDSLATGQKVDLLRDATEQLDKKIAEDSSAFKTGVYWLIAILGLWLGSELAFGISRSRSARQP